MTLREILDVTYAALVDDLASGFVSRSESRKALDDWLSGKPRATNYDGTQPFEVAPLTEEPNPDTWGMSPEAVAAQDRMMGLAGGT